MDGVFSYYSIAIVQTEICSAIYVDVFEKTFKTSLAFQ